MTRRRRPGQALIEFAIVLPVVILVFYAIFDVSRLMFTQISLDSGAQAAARLLASNRPETRRGDVYRAVTAMTPGVRVPADALRYRQLRGPDGGAFVEVELQGSYAMLSAFYVTSRHHIDLRARARAPLDLDATGGKVFLP